MLRQLDLQSHGDEIAETYLESFQIWKMVKFLQKGLS